MVTFYWPISFIYPCSLKGNIQVSCSLWNKTQRNMVEYKQLSMEEIEIITRVKYIYFHSGYKSIHWCLSNTFRCNGCSADSWQFLDSKIFYAFQVALSTKSNIRYQTHSHTHVQMCSDSINEGTSYVFFMHLISSGWSEYKNFPIYSTRFSIF